MSVNKAKAFQVAAELQRDRVELTDAESAPQVTAEFNATPPDERHTAPGRVQLEWVGDRSPLAHEQLAAAVRMGLVDKKIADAWEQMTDRLTWTTRIPYVVHRTMTAAADGLSQDYAWGPRPGTYVQEVTFADADKILSGPNGHEFRIVGYTGEQPADWNPIDRFLRPFASPDVVAKVEAIVIKEDRPQALSGVVAGSGSRVGAWTPTK